MIAQGDGSSDSSDFFDNGAFGGSTVLDATGPANPAASPQDAAPGASLPGLYGETALPNNPNDVTSAIAVTPSLFHVTAAAEGSPTPSTGAPGDATSSSISPVLLVLLALAALFLFRD